MTTPGTTITSPDALDAAPVGVVVRDIDGDLWARNSHPGRRGWTGLTPGCAEATSDDLTDDGPLVVVSVPGALDVEEMARAEHEYGCVFGGCTSTLDQHGENVQKAYRSRAEFIRAAILGGAA